MASCTRATILVVDEDPDSQMFISGLLRRRLPHVAVEGCPHIYRAQELLQTSVYDVIVIHVPVPGLEEARSVKRIRQAGQGAYIMLLAGSEGSPVVMDALRINADDFIYQPMEKHSFLLSMSVAIQKTVMQRRHVDIHRPRGPGIAG